MNNPYLSEPLPTQIPTDEMIQKMQGMNIPVEKDIRQSLIDPQGQFAADANKLWAKKSSIHCQQLTASIILIAGISTTLGLWLSHTIQLSGGAIGGICGGIYALYLCVGFICNPFFSSFSNVHHGSKFQSQYNRIRDLIGYFIFRVDCYHYQTRHHTRTVTDSDGHHRTQHYTTTEKVITYTGKQILNPRQCRDDSGQIDQIRAEKNIIFVHYFVNYRFHDDNSRNNFMRLWWDFQRRNRFDAHQDYHQQFQVGRFNPKACFFVGEQPPNYSCWFILFGLIGGMWPCAMFIEQKIQRFTINFMKVLSF